MEVGWSELLVIAVVALIVIGPKDLPEMFRTLGRFTAKMRAMARDFSRAMEEAGKETGLNEVADDLRKVANPRSMGLDAVKSAADKFEKWDPLKACKVGQSAVAPTGAATPLPSAAAMAGVGSAASASTAAAAVTEPSVASTDAPVVTVAPPEVTTEALGTAVPAQSTPVAPSATAAQESGVKRSPGRLRSSDVSSEPKDPA